MSTACPIHPDLIDERAARIGAGLVLLATVAVLAGSRAWPALLLAADFGLRSRGWSRFSPIAGAAAALRRAVGLAPLPVNAGPKRFAALVGAAFSSGIALAFLGHLPGLAVALGAVLLACAALEALLGFCVGCAVYGWLQKLLPRPRAGTVQV